MRGDEAMSEYVPTTQEVRNEWAGSRADSYALAVEHADAIAEAEFDRWLAGVERAAAARALEELAQGYPFMMMGVGTTWHEAQKALRARAAEIREGKSE